MKLLSRFVTLRPVLEYLRARQAAHGRPLALIALKASADALGKAVTLVLTVAAARRLNADPFGILAYAMATGWLLGVATDAGLSMYLARETARSRSRQLLFDVIGLRAGLAFLAATALPLLAPFLVPAHWRMQFIVIALAQLAGAVNETIAHYFRGIQRSEIESAIHTAQRLVTLVWGLIVLWLWRRLDYLGVAMLVPPLVAIVVSTLVASHLSSDQVRGNAAATLTPGRFFRDVFPLGAAVMISALYFRCDVYFIQLWHGFQPVGGYNAAFRIVEALRLLPAAVMAVTFPLLVVARDIDLVRRIGGGLTAIGGVLALVCVAGGPAIIPLIYGDTYAYAGPAFSILALALPLFFLNYALTHQVIGWNGQIAYLLIAFFALVANVAACLMLVPTRGIAGAAMATVLTEVVVTAGCAWYLMSRGTEPWRGALMSSARAERS